MHKIVRIGGAQGFYGDSPMGAMSMVAEKAVDYLMMDALAELTLSILQKDKLEDEQMGYARDIDFNARFLYPMAMHAGIKIVTNAGGLNPFSAARKLQAAMQAQGLKPKIAVVHGDDLLARIPDFKAQGLLLENMDSGESFFAQERRTTNANVYIGADGVKQALDRGADIVLTGRVADPALCVGILAHEFGWDINDDQYLDQLANGIMVGHILECGGQASGGNSYAEWPQDYNLSNLAYPIAHVKADGSATITRQQSMGGKVSRDTVREQLVYEIHDPKAYITPDVIVDLSHINVVETAPDQVEVSGAKGIGRPEKLKLAMGILDGYLTEQFFFFSWPYALEKAKRFEQACTEIWSRIPTTLDEVKFNYVGINGIHDGAAPLPDPAITAQLNEVGLRLTIRHKDKNAGKMAIQSIVCLGLNGPPGIVANPNWGKIAKTTLKLWPTLIPRELVEVKVELLD